MTTLRDELRAAAAREHEQILRVAGEIRAELDWLRDHPLAEGEPWDLALVVGAFRDHLVHHFEFEERGGPLDPELLHDAFLRNEARALVAEHRVFERRLGRVLADLDDVCPARAVLAAADRELRSVLADLRLHEATEKRLMLRL